MFQCIFFLCQLCFYASSRDKTARLALQSFCLDTGSRDESALTVDPDIFVVSYKEKGF